MTKLRRSLASLGIASLFALSLAMVGIIPAAAATLTYNVNTTDDLAYSLSAPVVCAPAPAPQLVPCSIRAAIQQANMAPSGTVTQISVPAGTYKITIARSCANDSDACGDFNVSSTVVLTGAGQATTFLDGNQVDRVFNVGSAGDLTMSGVTIQNGKASGSNCDGAGGGLLVTGNLSLSASTILNNVAVDPMGSTRGIGGGIAEGGVSPSTSTLDHVTVKGNRAANGAGAAQVQGICAGGKGNGILNINNSLVTENVADSYTGGVDEDAGGTVNITNSTVSKNVAHSPIAGRFLAEVGGVAEDGGGTVNIIGSTIDGNTSDSQGGGVTEDGGGVLKVSHSIVSNNKADDSAGGFYLDGGAKVTFDHLEVVGNSVTGTGIRGDTTFGGSGGGILEDGGDATTMTDVYVHDNTASHGAGMYLDGGGEFTVANLTVSHNTTALLDNGGKQDGFGAGILIDGGNKFSMINSTISDNTSASQGGGLMAQIGTKDRPISIAFSTIAGNTAVTGGQNVQIVKRSSIAAARGRNARNATSPHLVAIPPVVTLRASIVSGSATNCGGGTLPVSQGFNIDSGTSCKLAQTGDQGSVDPLLIALTNNGGFAPTRALTVGSPAIDAVATACPPPTTDQRGVNRPVGSACDVGAFEYVPPPPVTATAPAQVQVPVPALPRAGSGPAAAVAAIRSMLALGLVLVSLVLAAGLRLRREAGRQ